MQTIPFKDFKHGMRATCEVNGKKVEGKIAIDDRFVYFCSNCRELNGCTGTFSLGYKYIWSIQNVGSDFVELRDTGTVKNLIIYPEVNPIPYSKFKHGQRITCKIRKGAEYPKYISDAKISIDEDGSLFICQNVCSGLRADKKLGYDYSWNITVGKKDFTEGGDGVTEINFLDLEIGDVINTPTGDKTVLAVCGRLFFLSKTSLPDQLDDGYTMEEIIDRAGWIIKQEVTEDPIKEFTLQEVADKMGVAVENLRIKD